MDLGRSVSQGRATQWDRFVVCPVSMVRIVAVGLVALMSVATVAFVGAAHRRPPGAPVIANGYAGYDPGSTRPPPSSTR